MFLWKISALASRRDTMVSVVSKAYTYLYAVKLGLGVNISAIVYCGGEEGTLPPFSPIYYIHVCIWLYSIGCCIVMVTISIYEL